MVTVDLNALPTIQARQFSRGGNLPINRIVIHDMEAPETSTTAENVARYFSTTTSPASAHYNVDSDSIVRSVRDEDVAYHAPPNTHSIGIEHAGYASQRTDQWLDPYSRAMLHLSAGLTRALCKKYGVPIVFVPASQLAAGQRGITTHAEVSKAWRRTDHWDPGPGFPMDFFLSLVRDADPNPPNPPHPPGGAVPTSKAPLATILVHPNGGYLEIGEDGGVFAWGGAPFFGSLGNVRLNQPIVDAAWAPNHTGYFLLGRDGGVFAFGSAKHAGNVLWSG